MDPIVYEKAYFTLIERIRDYEKEFYKLKSENTKLKNRLSTLENLNRFFEKYSNSIDRHLK